MAFVYQKKSDWRENGELLHILQVHKDVLPVISKYFQFNLNESAMWCHCLCEPVTFFVGFD